MQTKKIPLRKCTGCGEMKPKKELIRVLHTEDGAFLIDRTGKKNGRGAYLCDDINCFKNAMRSHAIERSLDVTFSDSLYAQLEKEMSTVD